MTVISVEFPFIFLAVAAVCALLVWIFGAFSHVLRDCRYRVAFGVFIFALSGLMGFFSTLKFEISVFDSWALSRPGSVLLGIAYLGYALFGFLGCWTAVRIAGRWDRQRTLSALYTLLEERRKRKEN